MKHDTITLKTVLITSVMSVMIASCGQPVSETSEVRSTSAMSNDSGATNVDRDWEAREAASLENNRLKAFAYGWYARFDNGTTIEELSPLLDQSSLEFDYPQAKITSVEELFPQFESSWAATEKSGHRIEEIFVHPTPTENIYDIITPHTYFIKRKNETATEIDIVSRMRVKMDANGDARLQAYKVLFENVENKEVDSTLEALQTATSNVNDAKAFVHRWFAYADARNADGMIAMTSTGPLNVNLLGTEITDSDGLQTYLTANSDAQRWAIHQPHNISVKKMDDGYAVRFIVHFEGVIEGAGEMSLNNVTNWYLIEEDGGLRLRDYSLTLLQ